MRITKALMKGGMSAREGMDRICVRLSLAFWHLKAWEERAERPISVPTFTSEVPTLGYRGLGME